MANVITLPNGITIESTDPTAQNLTISREAYVVLENFSAESIYEAANFIMSQEDGAINMTPKINRVKDWISRNPKKSIAAGVGTATALTAAGVLAHKRKVAKKREAELAAMNQYDSTESFTLPTGQVVKIV